LPGLELELSRQHALEMLNLSANVLKPFFHVSSIDLVLVVPKLVFVVTFLTAKNLKLLLGN